ncbi:accessory Sec system protein Asp2 [Rossellomorea aquimaris]|uniref:accessory Sec system protein Asp2 n=1 Tax=Rossellomorea aquimaris TaxID=189382 RepID=UPI0011E9403B|nr:accessory Sec system protein Asp2 [Rossellomorea aquimaris]TYS91890.1 hypothetical protein FZC88_07085 [Rossellomorea aquimaris]
MTNATGEINTGENIEVIKKPKKIKEEAIYYGEKEIKYVFKKNEKSNFLTVGFSGIPKVGTPPRYNYMRTIMDIEVNQLFILDDHGMIGCYYLGENKDFAVERSIAGLIDKIAQENEIPKENIITMGSSKGGYASLYYGIKYNYGHVISASPQTKLGSYLIRQNIANAYIAQYISGGVREQNKVFLDDLLYEVVKESEVFPDIRIHCGIGEMHYTEHVIPLQRALMDKGVRIEVDLENYSNHNDVLKYYPEYLRKTLFGIIEQSNENKEREA